MNILLTRDDFRNGVFERDGHKCVFCEKTHGLDAHHIIERRLFHDGGYYLDNGATVCQDHHMQCEQTIISVEEVRDAAGITNIVVPDQMYPDHRYDKWGNHILPNGKRTRGPLFLDESVQKVLGLGGVLGDFTIYVKYPRTFHVTWSDCIHSDDKVSRWLDELAASQRVIITEKLDGENTSWYTDYCHARSINSGSHPSRDIMKALHARVMGDIPYGWRFNLENMYAEHSIGYKNLESYVYGFSIWDDKNICLSWDDTVEWYEMLEIPTPKVLYDGVWNEDEFIKIAKGLDTNICEGYVIRNAESFSFFDFHKNVAKFVRKDHVQTTKHWMHGQRVIPNKLKDGVKLF